MRFLTNQPELEILRTTFIPKTLSKTLIYTDFCPIQYVSLYCSDNVVILSASGTAVVLSRGTEHEVNTWSTPAAGREKEKADTEPITTNGIAATPLNKGELPLNKHRNHPSAEYQHSPNCSICHIPYPESSVPFHSSLLNCSICKKAKVSDVLFMTIEPPSNMAIVGRGCLIQARVCRNKRDSKGEQCAKEISDVIV